jgi:hypothetical protein
VCLQEGSSTEHRIKSLNSALLNLVYEYVCRSLFKADRLMFALHMVHSMFPDMFQENVSGILEKKSQIDYCLWRHRNGKHSLD